MKKPALILSLLLALSASIVAGQGAPPAAPGFAADPAGQTPQVGADLTLSVSGYDAALNQHADSRLVVYRKSQDCDGLYAAAPYTARLEYPLPHAVLTLKGQQPGLECFYAQFAYADSGGTITLSAPGRFRTLWTGTALVRTGDGRGLRESLLWWTPGGAYTILMVFGIASFAVVFAAFRSYNGAALGLVASGGTMAVTISLFGIPMFALVFITLPVGGAYFLWRYGS